MSGQFLSADMKFIEANFTGPEIDIRKILNEEEMGAIEAFEGPQRKLTRKASQYLSLNYRRYSTRFPVPWNRSETSETLELTYPYLTETTCRDITQKIVNNLSLPLRIKIDFWFLSMSTKKTEDGAQKQYEIVYPNARGAINDTINIDSEKDAQDLVDEADDSQIYEKLLSSHNLDLMAFKASGVSVARLLAISFTLTKLPAVPDTRNQTFSTNAAISDSESDYLSDEEIYF